MPVEPIKIPQNVYIEDRIVGPLTLKQIITVAIGCGFSYALYSLLVQSYGRIPLPVTVMAWVPGALSFVFAFVKINDLSLFKIILLLLERMNKPETRVWMPRRGIAINIRTFTTPDANAPEQHGAATAKNTEQIAEISSMLDHAPQPPSPEDEPEALSPLEETPDAEEQSPVAPARPVDPARISASAPVGQSTDTVTPPETGSISIFRDLSPR